MGVLAAAHAEALKRRANTTSERDSSRPLMCRLTSRAQLSFLSQAKKLAVGPDNPPKPGLGPSPLLQKPVPGQAKFRNLNLPDVENFPDLQNFSVSEENFYIGCQIT